ncbi:MAG: FIVAR domain-containing protein, partial [Clostridiales Family XIII bacterium]|nr:FIVAR domain-containing protein [Clostridiales Family XIII bacterium]
ELAAAKAYLLSEADDKRALRNFEGMLPLGEDGSYGADNPRLPLGADSSYYIGSVWITPPADGGGDDGDGCGDDGDNGDGDGDDGETPGGGGVSAEKAALAGTAQLAALLDPSAFTAASWKPLSDALAKAIELLGKNSPASAELESAANALRAAVKGLAPASTGNGGTGDGSGGGNDALPVPWDGKTIDVSWYTAGAMTYHIKTPAQLMGLAAIVNGLYNADITSVIGDDGAANKKIKALAGVGAHDGEGQNEATDAYSYGADDFAGKTVYLDANLDMGGTANYMPIGGAYLMTPNDTSTKISSSFNGTFDGQGHWVKNILALRHSDGGYGDGAHVGLFGRLGSHDSDAAYVDASPKVQNVAVTGLIEGNRSVGGIVGKFGRVSDGNRISVLDCANYAQIGATDAKGAGGIVGAAWNGGLVQNCFNAGDVDGGWPAGGIVGSNESIVVDCYSVGTATSNNGDSFAMSIGTNNDRAPFVAYDKGAADFGYPDFTVYKRAVWNVWYLSGTAPGGGYFNGKNVAVSNDGKMSEAEMRDAAFVSVLQSGEFGNAGVVHWLPDTEGANSGFPILAWMAANDGSDVVGSPAGAGTPADSGAPADKVVTAKLAAALLEAQAMSKGVYSEKTWALLEVEIAAAQSVLSGAGATQTQANAALASLTAAIKALEKVQETAGISKSLLSASIAQAWALDQSKYTAATWDKLTNAVLTAQDVYADEGATQAQVDAARTQVSAAIGALALQAAAASALPLAAVPLAAAAAADTAALAKAVKAAEALDEADYTTESWAALQTALKASKALLENGGAAQTAVDAQAKALSGAASGLKEIAADEYEAVATAAIANEDVPESAPPAESDTGENAGGGIGRVLGWIIAACLICAALAYIIIQRRKANQSYGLPDDLENGMSDRTA